MKAVVLILVLMIVGLSFEPCRDALAFGENDSEMAAVAATDDCPTSDDATEDCSPFCVCGCCALPVAAGGFRLPARDRSARGTFSEGGYQYRSAFENSYLSNIWQPPKV
ncbi:MAG: hypothetical protein IT174_03085 [Acidobacteria bacterium]|nr:hypothetical protein [Acidobacteriota bacterium]